MMMCREDAKRVSRDQVAEARIDNGTRSSNKGFIGVLRLLLHRRHHLGSSSKSLRIPAAE
jgi:hypothetical protein